MAFLIYDKDTERALYEQMSGFPLGPDQVLWLGPQSVKLLAEGTFRGKLPDKLIMTKQELGVTGWKTGKIVKVKK